MEKITEPINAQVLKKLRPEIAKMLTQMNVKYAEYKDSSIVFDYLDLKVTLSVKSKVRKWNDHTYSLLEWAYCFGFVYCLSFSVADSLNIVIKN